MTVRSARFYLIALLCFGLGLLALWNGYSKVVSQLPNRIAVNAPFLNHLAAEARLETYLNRSGETAFGNPSQAAREISRVNRSLPLQPEPYIWRAKELASSNRIIEARKALEYRRSRFARISQARIYLAQNYLISGRVDAALEELFSGSILLPGQAPEMMQIVRLIGNLGLYEDRVISIVSSQPQWIDTYLANIPPAALAENLAMELASREKIGKPVFARMLLELGMRRNHTTARKLWLIQNEIEAVPVDLPFNPGFAADQPVGPFNWTFENSSNVRIEHGSARSKMPLVVRYFGSESSTMLEQQTVLAPGSYRWTIPYKIQSWNSDEIFLSWSMSCLDQDDAPIATEIITQDSAKYGILELEFQIAEECTNQRVALVGKSRLRADRAEVMFGSVQ